ncbi:MAG: restriction endonuclease subunit S [Bacteroidaceae bacterium]|nr:restriction endonuclease subunit S [Bacteroidaceae bacterium]
MELKRYKLGEILDVTRGASLSGEFYATEGEYIRLTCGNFDYQNNCFKENTSKDNLYYIGDFKQEFLMQEGDIITPLTEQAIGLLGSTAIIPESGKYIQSQDVAKIVCKEDLLDKNFAFYLISSTIVKQQLSAAAQQTKIRHTSPDKIKDCTVWIPCLAEQKRIGNLLRIIDRKIELNRAINQNLEAMAKQLYDYWFVQFDFPDENGKPYKSSGGKMVWNEKLKREIPHGWFASNICIIADILSGGTPNKTNPLFWEKGIIPFFGPTDCNGNVFQIDTADHITQDGLEHCASSLFEEGVVIITARGSIGKQIIVGAPMAMNQSCYAFRSKKGEYEYLYFLTIQLIDCLKAKGSGSVFKSIITSDIENSLLCIAGANMVTKFCKTVKPLLQKIKENTIELSNLIKQRNELLPLLLNGQITIE